MDHQHEHIPSIIFDWIEHRPFISLQEAEREQVLLYFSREEYEELHQASFYIQKSQQAGRTSSYSPVKLDLLKAFDKSFQVKETPRPFLHLLWKAAAIFLLFLSGWLCHYLAGYRHSSAEIMAAVDTVFITEKNTLEPVHIFDTIYLEEGHSKPTDQPHAEKAMHQMQENRDATEFVPRHLQVHPPRTLDSSTPAQLIESRQEDSLPGPGNS